MEKNAEVDLLRGELQTALLAAEDIRALRAKVSMLVQRVREEKEKRLDVAAKHDHLEKKLHMITDHMEKLMNHLRIEAKQKSVIIASRRKTRKELMDMRMICEKQQQIIASKNRYISEMGEGCKLLEDQLRLMDEKYLDMRKKLDYARECQRQEMSRSQKEVSNLRKKFAMATGSSKLLDTYRLPSSNTPGPTSMDAAGRAVSWADFSDPSGMQGDSRVGTPQNRAKSAPMKRGKSASSPLIKANKHQEAISIDKVLNKIEKKRRELHGSCNTERAYELVAEFEEAQRPKTKGSKKNTREPDPVDMDYSVPIPMSLRQSEPEVLVVTEESICRSPMRSDSKTFSILGRSKH